MRFHYRAEGFDWWILPDFRNRENPWLLASGSEGQYGWGNYSDPAAAADDVYLQVTNIAEWNNLPSHRLPPDIGDIGNWEVLD